ncbi:hypothetical protein VCRA219O19_80040 [Vibrio crassostreae]|nr:hypothetical protein VCRA219O19_80040 [Vibrio crassostreae]
MHKWVLVTHCWTSNFSMEALENTENDLQIGHRNIETSKHRNIETSKHRNIETSIVM